MSKKSVDKSTLPSSNAKALRDTLIDEAKTSKAEADSAKAAADAAKAAADTAKPVKKDVGKRKALTPRHPKMNRKGIRMRITSRITDPTTILIWLLMIHRNRKDLQIASRKNNLMRMKRRKPPRK